MTDHQPQQPQPSFVGIDVSQATLDVALSPGGEQWRTSNDDSGIAQLTERLRHLAPTLIVLEASGGYELAVVATLASAQLPVIAVNRRLDTRIGLEDTLELPDGSRAADNAMLVAAAVALGAR